MPTARKKEEVPRWFVLAANLSLKLHGQHAFHAWERVVRCGGLLSALDPALASKHLDPQRQAVVLRCVGCNDKNAYDRQTPCDQDMLRKYVRDVPAAQWQAWFNGVASVSVRRAKNRVHSSLRSRRKERIGANRAIVSRYRWLAASLCSSRATTGRAAPGLPWRGVAGC